MLELIMAGLFVIGFLMAIGSFIIQHFFYRRLRTYHPQAWEKLGRPTQFFNNSISNGLAVWRFIQKGEYQSLGDKRFSKLIRFMRWYNRIFFVMFGAFLVLFCVKLWS